MTRLPPKKDVALALLEQATVLVHLDPRGEQVQVPAWFKRQPQLVLQIGLNMPKPINSANTQYVTCRFDHHSFLRSSPSHYPVVQAYRNISRTCKQYLYGDTNAEQFLILELRNQFKLPFYCETPVELIKDGAVPIQSPRNAGSPTRSIATTS